MNGSTLEKKSNLEYIEKEVGLQKFLPSSVLNSVKPKTLRKSLQQHFKKYGQLSESECFFKFFELLGKGKKYDQESFRCALGVSGSDDFNTQARNTWATLSCDFAVRQSRGRIPSVHGEATQPRCSQYSRRILPRDTVVLQS